MKINHNLKQLRASKKLSQLDMANILNVSLSSYQKYERDKNPVKPSLDVLERIADFYEVSIDSLLGRKSLPDPVAKWKLQEKTETDVIEKYMSLPADMRAMALELLRQLGGVVGGADVEEQPEIKRTITAAEPEMTASSDKCTKSAEKYESEEILAGELEDEALADRAAKAKDVG